MALLYAPRDWRNDYATLYHGTDAASAELIIQGIDLGTCKPGGDFGRGFSTTTALRQAEYWAQMVAGGSVRSGRPAIIAFEVDLDRLASLQSLIFIRGDFEAEHYWSFVRRCREDDVDHGRVVNGGWHDVVAGPVTAFWSQRAALPQYDQFSFHTQARCVSA